MKIKRVSLREFQRLLNDDFAVGKYYCKKEDLYIAGYFSACCLTSKIKSFNSKKECIQWLEKKGSDVT